jgi:hypothetical protein
MSTGGVKSCLISRDVKLPTDSIIISSYLLREGVLLNAKRLRLFKGTRQNDKTAAGFVNPESGEGMPFNYPDNMDNMFTDYKLFTYSEVKFCQLTNKRPVSNCSM